MGELPNGVNVVLPVGRSPPLGPNARTAACRRIVLGRRGTFPCLAVRVRRPSLLTRPDSSARLVAKLSSTGNKLGSGFSASET